MWFRYVAIAALSGVGCAGTQPSPPDEPARVDEPAPSVDTPAPPDGAEPQQPEPEASVPEAAAPKPKGAKACAELDENQCVVTEGCEWHTARKCLEQDKPKTLGD